MAASKCYGNGQQTCGITFGGTVRQLSPDAQFKGVKAIDKSFFQNSLNENELFGLLDEGWILVVRNAVNAADLRQRVYSLIASPPPISQSHEVLEGVENIHYVSHPSVSSSDGYSAADLSFYFFPWNQDETGITSLIDPLFNVVASLNGYRPEDLRKNTPKDGVVQRFHLICYPIGSGHISPHRDPVKVTSFTSGIYVTEFGMDYGQGGYYVLKPSGEKVYVDHQVRSGDLVVFRADFAHGVDKVDNDRKKIIDGEVFRGRIFLNMTIIESHHIQLRDRTLPVAPR